MKRILHWVCAAALCGLAGCGSDSEPVAGEPTLFSNVVFPTEVNPGEKVVVKADLWNTDELYSAWLVYYLDNEVEKTSEVSQIRFKPTQSAVFTGEIPGQKAGTKVTFQLAAWSVAGIFTPSEVFTYTVRETEN